MCISRTCTLSKSEPWVPLQMVECPDPPGFSERGRGMRLDGVLNSDPRVRLSGVRRLLPGACAHSSLMLLECWASPSNMSVSSQQGWGTSRSHRSLDHCYSHSLASLVRSLSYSWSLGSSRRYFGKNDCSHNCSPPCSVCPTEHTRCLCGLQTCPLPFPWVCATLSVPMASLAAESVPFWFSNS